MNAITISWCFVLATVVGALVAVTGCLDRNDQSVLPSVATDDRILVTTFFDYHREFIVDETAIREAIDRRDWVAVRGGGEALADGAAITSAICTSLDPSAPLIPVQRSFIGELATINATGNRIASMMSILPTGADPGNQTLEAIASDMFTLRQGYDDVYGLLKIVGDGGWTTNFTQNF